MPISLDSARSNELKIRRVKDAQSSYGNVGQILEVNPQGLAVWSDAIDLSGFVTNPLTASLNANGKSIFNAFIADSTVYLKNFTDELPAEFHSLAGVSLFNGISSFINPAYQNNLNPTGTNFPQGNFNVLWQDKLPVLAKASIIGRRTGLLVTAGTTTNTLGLGSTAAFQDRVIYDPMNMRGRPIGLPTSSAFTTIIIQPHTPIGILEFHTHIEGSFVGPSTGFPNPNRITIIIKQYDSLGNPIRDYSLVTHETYTINPIAINGSRFLMGFAPYSEDYSVGDQFEVACSVDAASNDFNISLAKTVCTVHPVN